MTLNIWEGEEQIASTTGLSGYWGRGNKEGVRWEGGGRESEVYKIEVMRRL